MVTYEEASTEGSLTVLAAVLETLTQFVTGDNPRIAFSVATVQEGVASCLGLPLTTLREARWNKLLSEALDEMVTVGYLKRNPMFGFDPSQN